MDNLLHFESTRFPFRDDNLKTFKTIFMTSKKSNSAVQ